MRLKPLGLAVLAAFCLTFESPLLLADVHVRGQLLARLSPGSTPGWNVLSLAVGPCAQPFPSPDDDDSGAGDGT